jgi:steroid 5-alpha reductase family enzyme
MGAGLTKAERRALALGRAIAIFISVAGILLGSILLGSKEKSVLDRLWPPTVAWVAWCVIGVIAGNIVRSRVQKNQAHEAKVEQSNGMQNRDFPK